MADDVQRSGRLSLPPWWSRGLFGRLALACLAACVVSGIALSPLYAPEEAFASLERIQAGTPWGWWLRSVHWLSAQGLLVACVAHLVEIAATGRVGRLTAGAWWRSLATLPLVVLALLGGFILRGDAEALAARRVWWSITAAVPMLGEPMAVFLMGTPTGTLGPALLHHAGTFTLLVWLLSVEHGRRLWPDQRSMVLVASVCTVLGVIVSVPLGPSPEELLGLESALGPWSLLGLQGLLLDLPVVAGWLVPALFFLCIGSTRHLQPPWSSRAWWLVGASAALYVTWGVRALVAL